MYDLASSEKSSKKPSKKGLSGFNLAGVLLISVYQWVLSPFLGGHCRFDPSCSEYSKEAFQTQGFLKALKMTAVRLFQCHPFGRSGYDPVIKKD